MKRIFGIVTIFILLATGIALVFEFSGNRLAQKETVTILRGQNAMQIASELKAEGYINSKLIFLYEVFATGNWKNLKAGEYDLKDNAVAEIVDKLARAKTASQTLTIVPGWTMGDINAAAASEKLFEEKEFLAAIGQTSIAEFKNEFDFLADLPADADLEGYLFPDTYQIAKETTAPDLARTILQNFEKKFTALEASVGAQVGDIHKAVIMASMLEKEVLSLEDKKIVAGILYKRLAAGMPLQVDSTLLYSKSGNLKTINKEIDSLYNTYKHAGLPAGPICNPGIESIEAAIEPIETSYWYYLSADDGTTIFSKTYDQHLQNIAQYLDKN